ncbi:hypothetical protein ACKUB1_15865 [Methanospirillum stamsii]|uniref:Glycosyltransferase RgtA/B/C/D-like domain-containing protein n=1 Tax=Methanospirillum stamsii TaxID=1277351 RepID=A0A2V2N871_9EURY|nr:hypothetical protein [Methanospirillum stamsii]PWR71771.1 hypothetical protein DLD82_13565 [Methanospirillum stamsii]
MTDLIIVTLLISAIFMVLIMLYLYILGNTIVGRKNGGLLISILSIPLIFSYVYYGFYPFFFAIVTILLILFLYQKTQLFPKNENAFYICVLFLSMFIVFCHPLVAIFLIITFLLVIFYNLFKRFVIKLQPSKNFDLNIFTVIAISFIFWFALVRLYIHTLTDMILTNLGGVDERTIINDQIDLVSSTHPASIWLYIEGFIKIYGPISIYLLLSIGFIVYILTQYYNKKTIFETDLFYSLLFCLALSLGISLFIGHSIYFEPVRVLMYSLIFSMILSGLFLYRIWLSINETQHKKIFSIIVTLITTILYMLCFFNLYQSPWTNMPNTAFTYEDKYGNDWILEYSNRELPIIKDDSTISKYSSYYFESQNSRNSEKMNEYLMIIPSNFGYNQYRNLGDAFATLPEDKFYMSTTEMMKIAPYAAREERRGWLDWFTDTDFIRLLNDPTVNSIYSNDEYSLFMVYRG